MLTSATPHPRRRRNWIIAASTVLALLVGGGVWWGVGGDSPGPGLGERLAGVRGVSSVKQDDIGYQVRFRKNVHVSRLSSALDWLADIKEESEYPRVHVAIGPVELRIDDTIAPKRAARVIVSVLAADAVRGTRVDPDAAHMVEVSVDSPDDILKTARTILDGYARHGVADVGSNVNARLMVRIADREENLVVSTEDPQSTREQLRLVSAALDKSDSSLYSARLGPNHATISVAVEHRKQMLHAYRALRKALGDDKATGKDDVWVTTRSDGLEIVGNGDVKRALAVVRNLEGVDAHVTKINADLSDATMTVNTDSQLRRVTELLAGEGAGGLDRSATITLGMQGNRTSFDAPVAELEWAGPLAVDLRREGFNVVLEADNLYRGKRKVLQVKPQSESDHGAKQVDLHDQATRGRLIATLRTGDWDGELLLQIMGLSYDDGPSAWGLRFRSTPGGKAHDVLFPRQYSDKESPRPDSGGSASDFLREWNATAGH